MKLLFAPAFPPFFDLLPLRRRRVALEALAPLDLDVAAGRGFEGTEAAVPALLVLSDILVRVGRGAVVDVSRGLDLEKSTSRRDASKSDA